MLPWLNLEKGDNNSGFEVSWMGSMDSIYTYWNKIQLCTRECELLPVNIMLTVVTYSVVFTIVFTLHWMYLQVRAMRVQFFLENASCHGLKLAQSLSIRVRDQPFHRTWLVPGA